MSLIYVKKFQKGRTLKETDITPLTRYYNKYDSENPYRDYLINEKYDYVNRGNKGLQNLFNVNEKNFPEQAEQRIRNQYDYDRNNYVIEQYAKENNIDLTDRESIMNNLVNAKILSKAMPNSKYAKFIEPSLWARTKGGAVSTANTILNAAGKEGPTFTPDIKGLTPAEEAKYYYPKGVMQKLGNAADTFSVLDIPGAAVMKYATNANQPTTLGDALTGTYSPSTLNAASLPGMVAAPAGLLYKAPDIINLAGKGLKQASKYTNEAAQLLTTRTPLKNAYKYNPWVFKPKTGYIYRQVGKPGYDDAINTKRIWDKGQEKLLAARPDLNYVDEYNKMINETGISLVKPSPAPFFSKDELFFPINRKATGKGNKKTQFSDAEYLFERKFSDDSFLPRYRDSYLKEAIPGTTETGVITPNYNRLKDFNIYKRHWWKGYKPTKSRFHY